MSEQIFISLQYIRKLTFNLRAKRKEQNIPFAHFSANPSKMKRQSKWRPATIKMAADLVSVRFACFSVLVRVACVAAIECRCADCCVLTIVACLLFKQKHRKEYVGGRFCGCCGRCGWWFAWKLCALGCFFAPAALPLSLWGHLRTGMDETSVCLFLSPPSMLVFALQLIPCVGTMRAHFLFFYLSNF